MSRNTIAQINLAAIRHNLRVVKRLAPLSSVVCVVKADAYGHGLSRVCPALDEADVLAVATTGEGFSCRERGWGGRLLLLEGPSNQQEFADAITMGAEMVVHHDNQLRLLAHSGLKAPAALWLKIDSGMHRLGFPPGDAVRVHAELERYVSRDRIILMSHFACADDRHNPMTERQLRVFDDSIAGLPGLVSLANSSAILNFPQSHRDYVRPGIMLYGVSPVADRQACDIGLKPAMTLCCDLIAINRVSKGETIGYGAAYTCADDALIGVAAIGYGDGYPRHARNGTPVLVNGQRTKLVGRVSMDMITLDLTGLKNPRVGDRVTLWGEGLPLEEVAAWANVIPYELICGVTARVRAQVV
jgi:alanine racemase